MSSEEPSVPVELYIYDLSFGMAPALSEMFLGERLDGIWHTAIVVHEEEVYFGGEGVMKSSPGRTSLGQPQKKVQLGNTMIPMEVLQDFLEDIKHKYSLGTYDLFSNNCNNFSNDVAEFLTGTGIDKSIVDMPEDIMRKLDNTPAGQMIKAQIMGSMGRANMSFGGQQWMR
eukprot:Clim_evm46s246 gene=Clim_evmTU46s246